MAGDYHCRHYPHKTELRIANGTAERVYWVA